MKRFIQVIAIISLLANISPYIYIGLTMLNLRTTNIYLTDPKNTFIGSFYRFFTLFYIAGYPMIILALLLIISLSAKRKIRRVSNNYIYIIIFAFLSYFVLNIWVDLGNYLNWFFD